MRLIILHKKGEVKSQKTHNVGLIKYYKWFSIIRTYFVFFKN